MCVCVWWWWWGGAWGATVSGASYLHVAAGLKRSCLGLDRRLAGLTDGDALGMDGTEVAVLQQVDQKVLRDH